MKISLAELLFLSVTQLGTVDVLCLGIFGWQVAVLYFGKGKETTFVTNG